VGVGSEQDGIPPIPPLRSVCRERTLPSEPIVVRPVIRSTWRSVHGKQEVNCSDVVSARSRRIYWVVQAGDLEPPGPPAPTMVTLQQIYDQVSGGPLEVATTGQTECYDDEGNVIPCSGTGQDGEYQFGVSVNPRFTENGDGTITDNLTRLIWLQNAECFGRRLWPDALSVASTLADGSCGLTDGSIAGDWRLPNVTELLSLLDRGEHNPALPSGHGFIGVATNYYTSTSMDSDPSRAWYVGLPDGICGHTGDADVLHVWPVRGGR